MSHLRAPLVAEPRTPTKLIVNALLLVDTSRRDRVCQQPTIDLTPQELDSVPDTPLSDRDLLGMNLDQSVMIFALSIAVAYALINIDGLFTFFCMATSKRYRQALVGLLLAQGVVVAAAYIAGTGVTLLTPQALSILGPTPLSLGFWQV